MTQETQWLDYKKPPPGYTADSQWWTFPRPAPPQCGGGFVAPGNTLVLAPDGVAVSAAWAHYKREHDPPHLHQNDSSERMAAAFGSSPAEWRAAAWAWHDRRRAIVLDIDEQTGAGLDLAVMLSAALAWTDAECSEVEAYAALTFPRGIDMPQALQRVLLPQGAT